MLIGKERLFLVAYCHKIQYAVLNRNLRVIPMLQNGPSARITLDDICLFERLALADGQKSQLFARHAKNPYAVAERFSELDALFTHQDPLLCSPFHIEAFRHFGLISQQAHGFAKTIIENDRFVIVPLQLTAQDPVEMVMLLLNETPANWPKIKEENTIQNVVDYIREGQEVFMGVYGKTIKLNEKETNLVLLRDLQKKVALFNWTCSEPLSELLGLTEKIKDICADLPAKEEFAEMRVERAQAAGSRAYEEKQPPFPQNGVQQAASQCPVRPAPPCRAGISTSAPDERGGIRAPLVVSSYEPTLR